LQKKNYQKQKIFQKKKVAEIIFYQKKKSYEECLIVD